MKNYKIFPSRLLIATLSVLLVHGTAFAHSGGTNAAGCHTNSKTGDYHCHNGGTSGGSSGGGGSTYTPSYTSPTTSYNCPDGQHYNSNTNTCTCGSGEEENSAGKCVCKSGFIMSPSAGYCIRLPANAASASNDEGWECNEGYEARGNGCAKVNVQISGEVKVERVVDGDTIKVLLSGTEETIRIIGIDTPETVDPRKPVQCFGQEASSYMKQLLEGKNVELQKNPAEERDKYDRLLRYVHLNGQDIGAQLIRDGYAFSYKSYPHPRLEQYNELEIEAREASRGLWNSCDASDMSLTTASGDAEFADVNSNHPYLQAIRWGKTSHILSGYADGTFQPDKIVNRAEFLKIVLEGKGIDVASATAPAKFTDVDETAWFAPYVRYAKAHGIIQGYADGTFKPEQAVNFAEALKMAYAALDVQGDESEGGEWYEKYLHHARNNSVLFSNEVNVGAGMTRKDVVWVVWRLLEKKPKGDTTPATRSSSSVSTSSKTNQNTVLPSGECNIKGNISSSKERIYHVPGCASYNQTKIDTSKGERMFCSEEEARNAGWRKALNCPN